MPSAAPGGGKLNGILEVKENFEVNATLYAESNKTKKTGPFGKKELKLVIMEVDAEGTAFSILGAVTINLNDFVGLVEHKLHVPVQCDAEIIDAVGQPYFDMTIRSWHRQGLSAGASRSSGISSTGWTSVAGSDSEDDPSSAEVALGVEVLDPVKPLDVTSPTIAAATTSPLAAVRDKRSEELENAVVQAASSTATDSPTNVNRATPERQDEGVDESIMIPLEHTVEETEPAASPAAIIAEQHLTQAASQSFPERSSLLSVSTKYKRLSTINSESGEEAMNDMNEDELKNFLETETAKDPAALENRSTPPAAVTSSSSVAVTKPDSPPEPTTPVTVNPVAEAETSSTEEAAKTKDDVTAPATTARKSNGMTDVTAVPSTAVSKTEAENRTPRPTMQRRSFWSWLPGSGLVCCQPALPRE